MTRASDHALEQKIIANVRDHGCHINLVSDPDGNTPTFAYSVGFPETLGQPEVILFGLPDDVMRFAINETMRKCREGFRLDDGAEIDGLLDGHVCVACTVAPEYLTQDYFASAMWFRQLTTGEKMDAAFQIVWPGVDDGLFPWDDGCADVVRDLQPCLIGGDA